MTLQFDREQIETVRNWSKFDADWYLTEYPDVRMASMDPAYHYLWLGHRIGRRPSEGFRDFDEGTLDARQLLERIGGEASGRLPQTNHARRRGPVGSAELIDIDQADPSSLKGLSVAVHAHVFYANLIDEFAMAFARMPCPFDLYISTPDEDTRAQAQSSFSKVKTVRQLVVRITPNRGRDIAPFVVEFGAELASYDLIAHIHTKKSLYNNGATDGWREYIVNTLFADPGRISYILGILGRSDYGIVYPQSFYNLPYMAHTWLANSGVARAWAGRFGVDEIPEGYFDFPAGSMFWARTDAIRPLLEAGLRYEDFPPEEGQTDGTLAHCIERMLGVIPTSRAYGHGVIRDPVFTSWSRWRLNQFVDRPQPHLQAIVSDEKIKTVAFDIFDTLLVRHLLDPDYVKTVLHNRYRAAGTPGFRDLRARAEADARNKKGRDVGLSEIYAELSRQDPTMAQAISMDDEIAMEIASVRPRPEVVELFNFARRAGKRVVLCSDMFLPRGAIETMLQRCGISGWDAIYLSSEVGYRKDRGDMYDYMLAQEKLSLSELVMVGDNERSDFQIPIDMGMQAIHVVKPGNVMRAVPRLEYLVPSSKAAAGDQFLFGAVSAENYAGLALPDFSPENMFGSTARSIGYGLLGPIVLSFSQWLTTSSRDHGIDQLYFLSREGKFLKAAYDAWTGGLDNTVPSQYLIVSRRAVTVPAIRGMEDIHAIATSNGFYGASMDMFLTERFGVELSNSQWRQVEARGYWKRDRPLSILDGNISYILPFLDFISPIIFQRAASERKAAGAYFNTMGVTDGGRAALVDVGYGATIQRHLNRMLDRKLHGFYMLANAGAKTWSAEADVILRECFSAARPDGSLGKMLEKSFLLEKMLSANDEQLMFYKPRGELHFRDMHEYVNAGRETRDEMQAAALNFVRDAVRFRETIDPSMTIDPSRAQALFEAFVDGQSQQERAIFGTLLLDDFYCGRGIVES